METSLVSRRIVMGGGKPANFQPLFCLRASSRAFHAGIVTVPVVSLAPGSRAAALRSSKKAAFTASSPTYVLRAGCTGL